MSGYPSRVGFGYQGVDKKMYDDLATTLPKDRLMANYTVAVNRFADVTLQFIHDMPFDKDVHKAANELGMRLALHF